MRMHDSSMIVRVVRSLSAAARTIAWPAAGTAGCRVLSAGPRVIATGTSRRRVAGTAPGAASVDAAAVVAAPATAGPAAAASGVVHNFEAGFYRGNSPTQVRMLVVVVTA